MATMDELLMLNDGATDVTKQLQRAMDEAAANSRTLTIPRGRYRVGSLFVPTGSHIHFEDGAELIGIEDLAAFKEIDTRIAGVEMKWPAAILNVLNAKDVLIDGHGVINGSGPYWWSQYWGADQHHGQREWYDQHQLRWIADYEIKRPRSILIYNTRHSAVKDVHLKASGFWNLQVTYCSGIEIANVKIDHNDGPSTDGIDIDSSRDVHIHHCDISCGDDCIALKSGRDGDGFRVNRPTENVEIDHCDIHSGYGITIGSEVSGGVKDVRIHDNQCDKSDCGFRIKSSPQRGGYIENIKVDHFKMTDVKLPFSWVLNWHTAYNHKVLPKHALPMWEAVAKQIPADQQKTRVADIQISNVETVLTDPGITSRLFDVQGFSELPIEKIVFRNCQLSAGEFGRFSAASGIKFDNVRFSIGDQNNSELKNFDNR